MFIVQRTFIYAAAFSVLIAFEVALLAPKSIIVVAPAVLFLLAFLVWYITGKNYLSRNFFHFFLIVVLLTSSGFAFFFFIEHPLLQQFVGFLTSLMVLLILRNVLFFSREHDLYQPYALENITTYSLLTATFFYYCSIYGVLLYFNTRVLMFLPASFVFTGLSTYLFFWVSKISWREGRHAIVSLSLLTMEIFYVATYLPTSFFVDAFILTAVYYVSLLTIRDALRKNFQPASFRRYLLVSVMMILIVFLTARWV